MQPPSQYLLGNTRGNAVPDRRPPYVWIARSTVARVEALSTMCTGHGLCKRLAPEVFQLDKWGCVDVVQPEVPEEQLEQVRKAVYKCPAKALLINEG
jgi:ferredoxin